jgi:glycerol uptake facilitator-like aquaporin
MTRRAAAEAVGTALLLAIVVGSGIMGERLAQGNLAIALLANSFATGAGLVALILIFAPSSGAHFNPVVTIVDAVGGARPWREVPAYVVAQIAGAYAGVLLAHAMFGLDLVQASHHARSSGHEALSEVVATAGLILTIHGTARRRADAIPLAVGAYIASAYWFTASTSFANPAVTLARSATDTFAGIRAADVPAFVGAQLVGAGLGALLARWLTPAEVTS